MIHEAKEIQAQQAQADDDDEDDEVHYRLYLYDPRPLLCVKCITGHRSVLNR